MQWCKPCQGPRSKVGATCHKGAFPSPIPAPPELQGLDSRSRLAPGLTVVCNQRREFVYQLNAVHNINSRGALADYCSIRVRPASDSGDHRERNAEQPTRGPGAPGAAAAGAGRVAAAGRGGRAVAAPAARDGCRPAAGTADAAVLWQQCASADGCSRQVCHTSDLPVGLASCSPPADATAAPSISCGDGV